MRNEFDIHDKLIENYKVIPCNSPSGNKQGWVDIFYEETPLKIRDELFQDLAVAFISEDDHLAVPVSLSLYLSILIKKYL